MSCYFYFILSSPSIPCFRLIRINEHTD